ncbi:T9SS C-terminal target domain-containing protein [Paraflavitalea soli]|uniref:T9SS C-terminal target domain-containing protein n=1 Tax=Paraflavitalea soli TaxID=2315862 RepID=A0A3B7MH17_9BACT|nr:T9SS type A sorting domain-containing protein [Paraflavitalea soli]AXY73498.1 T9SS C-terminal target domain-containing protein [Paraflavitalea soli]
MKRYFYLLLLLMLVAGSQLAAQCPVTAATPFDAARGGATATSGTIIFSGPGSTWVQDGGLANGDGGTMTIGGNLYINGDLRLSNNSSIVIPGGGKLFVYGNVYINSGSTLTINNGGNFYFYGEEWINQPGAVVNNAGGAGIVSFIMPRPAINAADPVSGSARYPGNATAYTATSNTVQYADGGGVDMDVNITNYNPNNVSLCNLDNSAAAGSGGIRLSGTFGFAAAGGHVVLNDNNFILSATGSYVHNAINAYEGYFMSNGTGVLKKEGIANSAAFTFPVGQAENDYTPVTLTNTSGVANDYNVQVKTYANSGSSESVPAEGIDRTWQVYAATAGAANICLQHNAVTNPSGTGTDGSLFTNSTAFVTQQTGSGAWSPGTQTDGGSPLSTHCAVYTLPASAGDVTGYFSKASDLLSPLPVTLASFHGQVVNCSGRLTWKTASESNSLKFVIEHSTNGVDFSPVGELSSENNSNGASYDYNYSRINNGTNYFRLLMVDKDDRYAYSSIISLTSSCAPSILITPNPVQSILTVRNVRAGSQVTVFNVTGQQMVKAHASGSLLQIDTQQWSKGIYTVIVVDNNQVLKTEKVVKQ